MSKSTANPCIIFLLGLPLCALQGCIPIPIRQDVEASSSLSLTAEAEPLRTGEGVVIIGRSASDDDIPGCVRNALAHASPGTRIVPSDTFRSRVGGRLMGRDAPVKDEDMEAILQEAAARGAVADLSVRYLFLIEGKTVEDNFHDSATIGVGVGSSDRRTAITATVWDAPAIWNLGRFSANAFAHPDMILILFILVIDYAPTESATCAKMAGEIQQFLSIGYTPESGAVQGPPALTQ